MTDLDRITFLPIELMQELLVVIALGVFFGRLAFAILSWLLPIALGIVGVTAAGLVATVPAAFNGLRNGARRCSMAIRYRRKPK